MEMTEREIVFKYSQNKDVPDYISVLADLNDVPRSRITDILREHGALPKKGRQEKVQGHKISDEIKEQVIEMRRQGLSFSKIGRALNISSTSAGNIVNKYETTYGVVVYCETTAPPIDPNKPKFNYLMWKAQNNPDDIPDMLKEIDKGILKCKRELSKIKKDIRQLEKDKKTLEYVLQDEAG